MSSNQHLEAYQSLYSTTSRVSMNGREKARYFLSNDPKLVCWACLGQHDSGSCTLKRCYRCAKPGHEMALCESTDYCGFCGQRGHSRSSQCYRQVYNMGLDPRQHEEVQCISCRELGHIDCKRLPTHTADRGRKRDRDYR